MARRGAGTRLRPSWGLNISPAGAGPLRSLLRRDVHRVQGKTEGRVQEGVDGGKGVLSGLM